MVCNEGWIAVHSVIASDIDINHCPPIDSSYQNMKKKSPNKAKKTSKIVNPFWLINYLPMRNINSAFFFNLGL